MTIKLLCILTPKWYSAETFHEASNPGIVIIFLVEHGTGRVGEIIASVYLLTELENNFLRI
jgi:hypothetical protein